MTGMAKRDVARPTLQERKASGAPNAAGRPARPGIPGNRRGGVNPALGAQTRKVLQQHYRARHGVK